MHHIAIFVGVNVRVCFFFNHIMDVCVLFISKEGGS